MPSHTPHLSYAAPLHPQDELCKPERICTLSLQRKCLAAASRRAPLYVEQVIQWKRLDHTSCCSRLLYSFPYVSVYALRRRAVDRALDSASNSEAAQGQGSSRQGNTNMVSCFTSTNTPSFFGQEFGGCFRCRQKVNELLYECTRNCAAQASILFRPLLPTNK